MKKFIIIILFILISPKIFPQHSVHYFDKMKNDVSDPPQFDPEHIHEKGMKELSRSVFGFLPYWELNRSHLNLRFDLLTHIALFDFILTENGSLTYPPGWPEKWIPVINEAQSNGIKILMTISNLTDDAIDSVLVSRLINNQSNKVNFFNDVKSIIASAGLDGIILDFENPKLTERGDPLTNFTQEVRDSLDHWFTGKELSFATPAVNWGNKWHLNELAEICDYLFIMGYDFHGSWSATTGPVAPLEAHEEFYHFSYNTIVSNDYADIDPSKLILGVPYYGARWEVPTEEPYQDVIPKGQSNSDWLGNPNYREIPEEVLTSLIRFDELSKTTYYTIPADEIFHLTWIDTYETLALKYDLINRNNYKGAGIWSLGKDGERENLWNLIDEKFGDGILSINNDNKIVNDFVLYQNYPNPFNPSTTIKYTIPLDVRRETSNARLIIYDILGREIKTLINKPLRPGSYEVEFDGTGLPSGVYFYKLTSGEFSQICKMLLMK